MTEIKLESKFESELINTYKEAKKLKYNPTRFLNMVYRWGGVETAKRILATEDFIQEGITKLWKLGGLSISLEAIVLKPEYRELFTDRELKTAKKRLEDLDYFK